MVLKTIGKSTFESLVIWVERNAEAEGNGCDARLTCPRSGRSPNPGPVHF